jgi:hypothetical protein
MRKALRLIVTGAAIAIAILAWVMSRPPSGCIDHKDASVLASVKVEEYRLREHLAVGTFNLNGSEMMTSGTRMFNYSSPHHLVSVFVHCDGGVEVSRFLEP